MNTGRTPPPFDPFAASEDLDLSHGAISLDSSHKVQDAIGRALEAHYVDLVREPIPDRLLTLLEKLEAGELNHE